MYKFCDAPRGTGRPWGPKIPGRTAANLDR
jgi:hypothetical protein